MAAQNAREGENGVAKDGEAKLRVKLDVDISDALTGLKSLQREARKATKALRELEEAQKGYDWRKVACDNITKVIVEASDAND